TERAQPPVTAVYFTVADQSRLAVDLLVGMMNGQRPARCGHLIPVHLTARGSTGRPEPARGPENRGGPRSTEGPHDRAARGHLDLADDRAQHMLEKAHHGGPHQHLFLRPQQQPTVRGETTYGPPMLLREGSAEQRHLPTGGHQCGRVPAVASS